MTGFLLVAIMSTISSQLLVASSSLTEDLYKVLFCRSASDKELVFVGRLSVLIVSLVAAALAYQQNDTILRLVGYVWAGFGTSFGLSFIKFILKTNDKMGSTGWNDCRGNDGHSLDAIRVFKKSFV
jgi:Na+/proline symporter